VSIQNVVVSIIDVVSSPDYVQRKMSSLILANYSQIFPIVYDYFHWCSDNSATLTKDSRKDEIIMSVNPSTRAWLKNEVYQSHLDILKVYRQKYREKLTNISIPLQPYTILDIEQARKDIVREKVLINKRLYFQETYASSSLRSQDDSAAWQAIRSELLKILVFLFNIDNPSVFEDANVDLQCKTPQSNSLIEDTSKEISRNSSNNMESSISMQKGEEAHLRDEIDVVNGDDGYNFRLKAVESYNWDLIDALNAHHRQTLPNSPGVSPTRNKLRNTSAGDTSKLSDSSNRTVTAYGDILELLHCHVVLAASRTIAAGDAFIILNDLFGGDGLVFCPTACPRESKSPAASLAENCDISLALTTNGIKVVLKERYRLYVENQLDLCSRIDDVQPLMQFECTTSTIILISPESFSSHGNHSVSMNKHAVRLLNTLIINPSDICHRAVSIEPYI
jgi:hypothetical protein